MSPATLGRHVAGTLAWLGTLPPSEARDLAQAALRTMGSVGRLTLPDELPVDLTVDEIAFVERAWEELGHHVLERVGAIEDVELRWRALGVCDTACQLWRSSWAAVRARLVGGAS